MKTNGHLTCYRVAVTDIMDSFYPELAPTFMWMRPKIQCLLNTISWKTNGDLTTYRVAVTDIMDSFYPELAPTFMWMRPKIQCLLNTISWKTNGDLTTYRVAVGLLVGQGWEWNDLPCLADGVTKLGRRSWSFYMCRTCCLLDWRIYGGKGYWWRALFYP